MNSILESPDKKQFTNRFIPVFSNARILVLQKRLYWIESWCFLPLLKHLLILLLSQFNVVAGCLLSFYGDDRPEIARIQLRR
jgi:hypothetical protein